MPIVTEKLTPTGIPANDKRREIFVDQSGIGWDLRPDYQSGVKYEVVGPASDPRRVLVRDSTGMIWDVTPAKAAELTG